MNLLLFGGSGPTGRCLIKQGLDLGHKLTVIARSPDILAADIKHENLTIVKGDATEQASFDEHMQGKDAVVSSLGVHPYPWESVTVYTKFATEVEKSMEKHNVSRIVAVSSWGVRGSPKIPFFLKCFLAMARNLLNNLLAMEEQLEKSQLNYTIVKVA